MFHSRIVDPDTSRLLIIMEFCAGGDIAKLIKSHKAQNVLIKEEVIWKYAHQIFEALKACHQHSRGKILHRDLKPGNIFLDKDGNIKLGDFGLSKLMGNESVFANTHVGTPYYMSPELM